MINFRGSHTLLGDWPDELFLQIVLQGILLQLISLHRLGSCRLMVLVGAPNVLEAAVDLLAFIETNQEVCQLA